MDRPKLKDFVKTVKIQFPEGEKEVGGIDFPGYAFALETYADVLENYLRGVYKAHGKTLEDLEAERKKKHE